MAKTGFNGASAFRRWKSHGLDVDNAFFLEASMGPPPFGGGNHFVGPQQH